jgi:hypothetical protein
MKKGGMRSQRPSFLLRPVSGCAKRKFMVWHRPAFSAEYQSEDRAVQFNFPDDVAL